MGVVSFILGLPLAPVRGVISLGRVIQERVETEMRDPASVRRDLEAAEEAREAGEISPGEEARVQQEALDRMTGEPESPGAVKE
ncbi:gas vesicle protein G [Prauserella sp. PE36]|uniref:gas vesicle protein GvpG n=1 Tax=Prauserella sp. PE36 TaxID=1504709 RepID=UPI000D85AAFB|nr:gas vesicle protein GvpG [Prauserella sp. PE36]PXY23531.1 gas vesicle protein G [Prauserella coralliicola]RBM18373.1 gas vesicle protein G [Prauserella sp. PE36]